MMNGIILNADDYGITQGVSRGIAHLLSEGRITRTSVMTCVRSAASVAAEAMALQCPIGVHLQLTGGRPLLLATRVPSLVEPDGTFPEHPRHFTRPLRRSEIFEEWEAQLRLVLEWGVPVSHLDTHHHVHRFPEAFHAYLALCKKYKLAARALSLLMWRKLQLEGIKATLLTDKWSGNNFKLEAVVDGVVASFKAYPDFFELEVVCHPGYSCAELAQWSTYGSDRDRELIILSGNQLHEELHKHNIGILHPSRLTC